MFKSLSPYAINITACFNYWCNVLLSNFFICNNSAKTTYLQDFDSRVKGYTLFAKEVWCVHFTVAINLSAIVDIIDKTNRPHSMCRAFFLFWCQEKIFIFHLHRWRKTVNSATGLNKYFVLWLFFFYLTETKS